MKIILSPAKKMNVDIDSFDVGDMPQYIEQTKASISGHKDDISTETEYVFLRDIKD